MNKLKSLFKNKKGASKMIEMLIITPIALFIVLLSLYKILGMIVSDQMNSFNQEVTRSAIVASNFDDAMILTYNKMQENTSYKLSYVKIYYVQGVGVNQEMQSITLNFSLGDTSTQNFNSYFSTDGVKTSFNSKKIQEQNRELYDKLQYYWQMSNLFEVGLYNDLTQNIYANITKVSIMVDGERKTFSFGLDSTIRTSNVQVISCER